MHEGQAQPLAREENANVFPVELKKFQTIWRDKTVAFISRIQSVGANVRTRLVRFLYQ